MNNYRQKITAELAKNNIFCDSRDKEKQKNENWRKGEGGRPKDATLINAAILDAAIALYRPKKSRWGCYEEIMADPLPFMIFLLKLLEWKKSLDNT